MGLKRMGGLALLGLALATAGAHAQAKFSGQVFGDYYYYSSSHDPANEDHNGFWIRRINLSWDQKFDETFSARVRLETANPGDFDPSHQVTMLVYAKDAFVKWQKSDLGVLLGLSTTPSHSYEEELWGYRDLEKIPGELQGFYTSRDMGLAVQGAVGAAKKFNYHVMLGNGTGTSNETDSRKKVGGEVRYALTHAFTVEVYGDFEDRPDNTDRTTFRGMAAFKTDRARAGAEFVQQSRDQTAGGSKDYRVVSGFVAGQAAPKVWLVGRVDRVLDAGLGQKSYIFIDGSVKSTFILAGVDFRPNDAVSIIPNVEAVAYDTPDSGTKPDSEIIPRLTFQYKF